MVLKKEKCVCCGKLIYTYKKDDLCKMCGYKSKRKNKNK